MKTWSTPLFLAACVVATANASSPRHRMSRGRSLPQQNAQSIPETTSSLRNSHHRRNLKDHTEKEQKQKDKQKKPKWTDSPTGSPTVTATASPTASPVVPPPVWSIRVPEEEESDGASQVTTPAMDEDVWSPNPNPPETAVEGEETAETEEIVTVGGILELPPAADATPAVEDEVVVPEEPLDELSPVFLPDTSTELEDTQQDGPDDEVDELTPVFVGDTSPTELEDTPPEEPPVDIADPIPDDALQDEQVDQVPATSTSYTESSSQPANAVDTTEWLTVDEIMDRIENNADATNNNQDSTTTEWLTVDEVMERIESWSDINNNNKNAEDSTATEEKEDAEEIVTVEDLTNLPPPAAANQDTPDAAMVEEEEEEDEDDEDLVEVTESPTGATTEGEEDEFEIAFVPEPVREEIKEDNVFEEATESEMIEEEMIEEEEEEEEAAVETTNEPPKLEEESLEEESLEEESLEEESLEEEEEITNEPPKMEEESLEEESPDEEVAIAEEESLEEEVPMVQDEEESLEEEDVDIAIEEASPEEPNQDQEGLISAANNNQIASSIHLDFDRTKFVAVEQLPTLAFHMNVDAFNSLKKKRKLKVYFESFLDDVLEMGSNQVWFPSHQKEIGHVTMELLLAWNGDETSTAARSRSGRNIPSWNSRKVVLLIDAFVFVQKRDGLSYNNESEQDQTNFYASFLQSLNLYFQLWGLEELETTMAETGGLQNPTLTSVVAGETTVVAIETPSGSLEGILDDLDWDGSSPLVTNGIQGSQTSAGPKLATSIWTFATVAGLAIWGCL